MARTNTGCIYAVEGNISCGKSSILDYVANSNTKDNHIGMKNKQSNTNNSVFCVQEPVGEWTNMKNGTDLLKLFYQENQRWSHAFESMVQLSRLQTFVSSKAYLKEAKSTNENNDQEENEEVEMPPKRVFCERSIFSSFNVFAQNSYEDGGLNSAEYSILQEYYKFFVNESFKNVKNASLAANEDKDSPPQNENENENEIEDENENENYDLHRNHFKKPDLPFKIIYVRTDPHVCYERLVKRDRSAEVTIGLDYLTKIHEKYEAWIGKMLGYNMVHFIDGNVSKERVLAQIDQFINKTSC